jgi:AcrR family transcriptional regulator
MRNHTRSGITPSPKRESYHHGDLRRDLLRVAWEEIAAEGAANLTLASLARRASVAQSAPYRHFADRRALLEAVAAAGFAKLSNAMREAVAAYPSEPMTEVIARAYVRFGEANIEIYRLMFASRLTSDAADGSALDVAAGEALALLRASIVSEGDGLGAALGERTVYLSWAKVHGLVMLKADGFITSELTGYVETDAAASGRRSS